MKKIKFTDWNKLSNGPSFDKASFLETFDGGQSFSWTIKQSHIEGIFSKSIFRLKLIDDKLAFSVPINADLNEESIKIYKYISGNIDFEAMRNELPWRSDRVLQKAINAFPYLRILSQPIDETLFGFLCSSAKQITQIKQIINLASMCHGENIGNNFYSLPSWKKIYNLEVQELKQLKLGYRAKFIKETSIFIKNNSKWLSNIGKLSLIDLKRELMQLPGVGEKIADCIALFGFNKFNAFPIDTWIRKILTDAYALRNLNDNQLQNFAQVHYGQYAGYAQQFLFAAARSKIINS